MIVGIGIDVCAVHRIEQAIRVLGDRFLDTVFTEAERRSCGAAGDRAARYACVFAAKEATAKALGVGIETVLHWHDLEILGSGRRNAVVELTRHARVCVATMVPPDHTPVLRVSLSCTSTTAQAVVIFEAVRSCSPRAG